MGGCRSGACPRDEDQPHPWYVIALLSISIPQTLNTNGTFSSHPHRCLIGRLQGQRLQHPQIVDGRMDTRWTRSSPSLTPSGLIRIFNYICFHAPEVPIYSSFRLRLQAFVHRYRWTVDRIGCMLHASWPVGVNAGSYVSLLGALKHSLCSGWSPSFTTTTTTITFR